MSKHSLILKHVSKDSDLKNLVISIAKVQKKEIPEIVKSVKNLPYVIVDNADSALALKLVDYFSKFKVELECSPPVPLKENEEAISTQAEESKPQPAKQIEPEKEKKVVYTPPKAQKTNKRPYVWVILTLIVFAGVLALTADQIVKALEPQNKVKHSIAKGNYKQANKLVQNELANGVSGSNEIVQQAINLLTIANEKMKKTDWKYYGGKKSGEWGDIPSEKSDLFPVKEANQALKLLHIGEKKFPNNAEVQRWLAYVYKQKGFHDKAEIHFKKTLEFNPKNILYLNLAGNFYVERELDRKADITFRKALQLDSSNTLTLKNLAILHLYQIKDSTQALKYLYSYFKKKPKNDFNKHTLRTEMMAILWKKFNKSIFPDSGQSNISYREFETYRKNLDRKIAKGADAKALEERGILYGRKGMHPSAILELNKAVTMDKKLISAYKALAHLYALSDRTELMINSLKKGDQYKTRDAFFFKNLALVYKYYYLDDDKAREFMKKYLMAGSDLYKNELIYEFN